MARGVRLIGQSRRQLIGNFNPACRIWSVVGHADGERNGVALVRAWIIDRLGDCKVGFTDRDIRGIRVVPGVRVLLICGEDAGRVGNGLSCGAEVHRRGDCVLLRRARCDCS